MNASFSAEKKEKRRLTNIERYGVSNVFENEDIQNKLKEISNMVLIIFLNQMNLRNI